jgi:hypothetical protein
VVNLAEIFLCVFGVTGHGHHHSVVGTVYCNILTVEVNSASPQSHIFLWVTNRGSI